MECGSVRCGSVAVHGSTVPVEGYPGIGVSIIILMYCAVGIPTENMLKLFLHGERRANKSVSS